MRRRVLVVGAGPTGAAIARALASPRFSPAVECIVVDKGSTAGGRMATAVARSVAGAKADTGAQYLTDRTSRHRALFQELVKAGTLAPVQGRLLGGRHATSDVNYMAPQGISAVPQLLLQTARGVSAFQSVRIDGLSRCGAAEVGSGSGEQGGSLWRLDATDLAAAEAGKPLPGALLAPFDAVILTLPVPQLLTLGGADLQRSWAHIRPQLEAVRFSTRYALTLFFPEQEAGAVTRELPFAAQYIKDASPICFVAMDSTKRGAVGGGAAVVVHSTTAYGAEKLGADPTSVVGPELLLHFQRLYPSCPAPLETRCHRWKFSQVAQGYAGGGAGGVGAVAVADGTLILAGDAFTESNFEGCLDSADKAVALLAAHLGLASE